MIRKLTAQDKGLFFELVREFYTSDAVAHDIPEDYHIRTFAELMAGDTYLACYILEQANVPCGYCLLNKTWQHEAGGIVLWIEELYIRPEFRSRGLGSELFAFLETLDHSWLRLEVEPDNDGAIRLYQKRGFTFLPYASMVRETDPLFSK